MQGQCVVSWVSLRVWFKIERGANHSESWFQPLLRPSLQRVFVGSVAPLQDL